MEKANKKLVIILILMLLPMSIFAKDKEVDESVRKEREYIRNGNRLYNSMRFAEAEVEYKKALSVNPNSHLGNYNLAMSLIHQSSGAKAEDENNPLKTATELLGKVAQGSKSAELRSKAFYNLGNIAYHQQQYDQSIELYKNALRQNPDDNQARENLRLAQLKKKEQEQNKDKQNKDDKKDKEQNKDKQEDKKDQQQDKQNKQDKNEDKKDQQKQQQPQQQQALSKENMEQILKTMQNQEKATQEKVKAQKPQNVRKTGNQW